MKKKLTAVVLLLALALSAVSAGTIFQLGVAASLPFELNFDEPEEMAEAFTKLDNYKFGADVRVNIPLGSFLGLHLDALPMISVGSDGTFNFDTVATVGLLLFRSSMINISAGLGPSFLVTTDWKSVQVDGATTASSMWEAVKVSPFYYRATIDIHLGFLGLGVSYLVPMQGTISTIFSSNISGDDFIPDFSGGKLAVSLILLSI